LQKKSGSCSEAGIVAIVIVPASFRFSSDSLMVGLLETAESPQQP
jgi:hypothetical protein